MAFHLKLIQPKELPHQSHNELSPTGCWQMMLPQRSQIFYMGIFGWCSWWEEGCTVTWWWCREDSDWRRSRSVCWTQGMLAQLNKLVQHIQSFVYYTEQNDIHVHSTSMEWIFSYLRKHYNIEAKWPNLLKITDHILQIFLPSVSCCREAPPCFPKPQNWVLLLLWWPGHERTCKPQNPFKYFFKKYFLRFFERFYERFFERFFFFKFGFGLI